MSAKFYYKKKAEHRDVYFLKTSVFFSFFFKVQYYKLKSLKTKN